MGINRQESINNHFYILVCYNNENQAVNDVPVPGDESEDVIDDEDVIDEEDDIDEEDVVDDEDVVDEEEEDVIDDVIDKEVAEEN